MQAFTYLLVNFFTVIIAFIFSFHKKIKFHRHFTAFLKAAFLVAIPFIIWDIVFTKLGVWWFDIDYTIGVKLFGLPVEEWLFFICIPFACVFTYFCLDKFFNLDWTIKFNGILSWLAIIVCVAVAIKYYDRIYPLVTASATALTMIFLHFIAKVNWIGKASFVYLILMLGFFPVNGVLTGTGLASPVVNYNPEEILNIRMLTIPVEDMVYGYTQFMLCIFFFKLFKSRRTVR